MKHSVEEIGSLIDRRLLSLISLTRKKGCRRSEKGIINYVKRSLSRHNVGNAVIKRHIDRFVIARILVVNRRPGDKKLYYSVREE